MLQRCMRSLAGRRQMQADPVAFALSHRFKSGGVVVAANHDLNLRPVEVDRLEPMTTYQQDLELPEGFRR